MCLYMSMITVRMCWWFGLVSNFQELTSWNSSDFFCAKKWLFSRKKKSFSVYGVDESKKNKTSQNVGKVGLAYLVFFWGGEIRGLYILLPLSQTCGCSHFHYMRLWQWLYNIWCIFDKKTFVRKIPRDISSSSLINLSLPHFALLGFDCV